MSLANSLKVNNYGTFLVKTDLSMEFSEFHNHHDLIILAGNLVIKAYGMHEGRFFCNVTTNTAVLLDGVHVFKIGSRYFGNALLLYGQATFNGIIGIR